MIKAHKIRLNPTLSQTSYFYRAAGIARFAWNWALAEYHRLKAAGQEIDWNEIKKAFRARIDTEFPFVREVTKCAAEQAIDDLRQAINIYYKTKKNHWTCGQCGAEHDRDLNASINQELEGVRLLVGSGSLDARTVEFAAATLRCVSMQVADVEAVRK